MQAEREVQLSILKTSLYPTLHLSIRGPWHDNRWAGTTCQYPRDTACIRLKNISDAKEDEREEEDEGRREAWRGQLTFRNAF